MASKIEIIRRTNAAKLKLEEALTTLSGLLEVSPVDVRGITFRRDPDYERMLQWQALAKWADDLADAAEATIRNGHGSLGAEDTMFLLSNISKAKLVDFAAGHGFEVDEDMTREDIASSIVSIMFAGAAHAEER